MMAVKFPQNSNYSLIAFVIARRIFRARWSPRLSGWVQRLMDGKQVPVQIDFLGWYIPPGPPPIMTKRSLYCIKKGFFL